MKINFVRILINFLFIIIISCIYRCAKPGIITGGPKDLDPPKMVGSNPEIFAKNFKGKKVIIDFDEYLQLKNISQQFNVSPPFKKKPLIWLKNKSIVLQYTDTLKDSTTYTLSFGNGIADNNEGNILPNFEFAFSTGNYIDSMCVRGRILDAFTLKPDKESLLAILYSDLSDSAPYKKIPIYTGRTDKDGYYSINNIKPGTYKLYALKDNNFNYKYDPSSEAFAFIDSLVILDAQIISQKLSENHIFPPDTARHDTIHKKTLKDSVLINTRKRNSIYLDMFTYSETDKRQFVKDYSRKEKRRLDLIFNKTLIYDTIFLQPLYFNYSDWYQLEFSPGHDSIFAWITDTILIKTDTLKTIVQYWGTTKKGDTIWTADTLNFRFAGSELQTKKSKKSKPHKMKLGFYSHSGTQVDIYDKPYIETDYPIINFDINKIFLSQKIDSTEKPCLFKLLQDTINLRRFHVDYKWEEQSNYSLLILPGSFENIYGINHDTLKTSFSIQKSDYYGNLSIHLSGVISPIIVQLLDKDKVVAEKFTSNDGIVTFNFLMPKTYNLKIVFDNNIDNAWTTGDFLNKEQPEKVIFYNGNINIRSNWDVDISWNIK